MKPKDKELYNRIKEQVIKKYPKHSAYRSMIIQKEYQKQGGEYIGNKKNKSLNRWLDEEWINVYAYLIENKIVKCGDEKYIKYNACRPLIRINNTPITLPELLKKYSRNDLLKLVYLKSLDPENRIIQWKNNKVINKKN